MSRSSSYYYVIMKLSNPTADALETGLNLDDLLEAAEAYNSRFKGLKQLLILKTEGVRIHAFLTMTELTGVTIKRSQQDFSTHLSVFSNFLLNQKKWSVYSQDYRRLIQIAKEPESFVRDELLELLSMIGYTDELAVQAKSSLKFVGPSERTQYKWYLHVQYCLQHPPHLAFSEKEQTEAIPSTPVPSSVPESVPASVPAPIQTPIQEKESTPPAEVIKRKPLTYSAPAHIIRQHYQQATGEVKTPIPKEPFAEVLEQVDEPLDALRVQSEAEYKKSKEKQIAEVFSTSPAPTPEVEDELEYHADQFLELPDYEEQDFLFSLDDEQMMTVLHALVLTQNLGDQTAVENKKKVIENVKQLISPWATFG